MNQAKCAGILLMLFTAISVSSTWARGGHGHHGHHGHGHHGHGHHGHHGHHHGHHHHRHGGWGGGYGLALGMGMLGYGLGSWARAPSYYPPRYGYGYGYPAGGYGPGYGGYGYGGYSYGYAPAAPPVYIQQEFVQAQPAAPASGYWHYCRKPEGYYPYVKTCPEGWLQVAPQPSQ